MNPKPGPYAYDSVIIHSRSFPPLSLSDRTRKSHTHPHPLQNRPRLLAATLLLHHRRPKTMVPFGGDTAICFCTVGFVN
ncbi:hypothetical protein CKAN_02429400 [Cinnamomum micranthum f. kanehirae]|uniref:Uncharacterized protein n=1 Tax=Cinnamomum micranthum f. kanehirae TaxID=337451 RepID=A0A443PW30_9MAGN|nr:hypothetical protein CKAN_02429400 [Cinnamomum micranthum f. kanehirae]